MFSHLINKNTNPFLYKLYIYISEYIDIENLNIIIKNQYFEKYG